MPRYTVEVPIWATVYVDAPDEAAALAKVREECADYLEVELGGDLSPFGDDCMLSAVGTVHPLDGSQTAEFYEEIEADDEAA